MVVWCFRLMYAVDVRLENDLDESECKCCVCVCVESACMGIAVRSLIQCEERCFSLSD